MGKVSVETDKVFRVSLPGYDAHTATPEEHSVHSGLDYPKIEEHLEGYSLVTAPNTITTGDTVLLTINHNYGYVPYFLVYMDDVDNIYTTDFAKLPYTSDAVAGWTYYVVVSTTQLKVCIYYNGAWGNIVAPDEPAGKRIGIKYQVWINS